MKNLKKKIFGFGLLTLTCLLGFTSCSSKSYSEGDYYSDGNSDYTNNTPEDVKFVYSVYYSFETKDINDTYTKVKEAIVTNGGYVSYVSESDSEYGYYIFKVPVENLTTTTDSIDEIENRESKSLNSYAVTSNYSYLSSRLEYYNNQKSYYETMLTDDTLTVQDKIDINKELAEINSEIEYLQERISTSNNDLKYASIRVRISKKESLVMFSQLGQTFVIALTYLLYFLCFISPLLIIAAIVLLSIFIPKIIKKKKLAKENVKNIK